MEAKPIVQLCKSVLFNRKIKSLNLSHSKLTDLAITALCNGLKATKRPPALAALSLSHCYLDPRQVILLSEMLKHNRSLVKLELSYNGLISNVGRYLIESLRFNYSLNLLNLSHNSLDSYFCHILAEQLKRNTVLYECDLGGNPFGEDGAAVLIECLGVSNKTLHSLGDLAKNPNLGICVREQLRSKTLLEDTDFELLESIEETNPPGYLEVLPWNLSNAIL